MSNVRSWSGEGATRLPRKQRAKRVAFAAQFSGEGEKVANPLEGCFLQVPLDPLESSCKHAKSTPQSSKHARNERTHPRVHTRALFSCAVAARLSGMMNCTIMSTRRFTRQRLRTRRSSRTFCMLFRGSGAMNHYFLQADTQSGSQNLRSASWLSGTDS